MIVTLQSLRQMVVNVAKGISGVQFGARPAPIDEDALPALGVVAIGWIGAYLNAFEREIADRESSLAGSRPVLAAVGARGEVLLRSQPEVRPISKLGCWRPCMRWTGVRATTGWALPATSHPEVCSNSANNSASATTTVNPIVNYPRPKGATPLYASLVPAYTQCTAPNRVHGPPDFPGNGASPDGSCNPPLRTSSRLTVGSPDANGAVANSSGFVRLQTQPTPADMLIDVNITDVRCDTGVSACGTANSLAGPDYTGQVQATYTLRITDKFSGTGGGTAATVIDTTYPVTVACAQTAANTIGGTCLLSTSANALVPNTIRAGFRTIWQAGQVQVFDGGSDGLVSTAGNSLFENQGVFVP